MWHQVPLGGKKKWFYWQKSKKNNLLFLEYGVEKYVKRQKIIWNIVCLDFIFYHKLNYIKV